MKREDEAPSRTSKMEKKEERKNAFLEIILWSNYLEFPFFMASYCYPHYTIYQKEKQQQNPPQTCKGKLFISEKTSRCPLVQPPTDSSASLHRANLEQMVADTYGQMRNSRKFTTAFGQSVYQMERVYQM